MGGNCGCRGLGYLGGGGVRDFVLAALLLIFVVGTIVAIIPPLTSPVSIWSCRIALLALGIGFAITRFWKAIT